MRHCRYVALLCLLTFRAGAQDISSFSQFFLNPYALNPSYAGIEGRSAFFLAYRKQWTTIQGSPVLANLTYHTALNKRVSFGLNINSDKRGITNTSSFMLTGGYTVPIDNTTFVRFGLSVGYGYNSVDWDKVGTISDPALSNMLSKNSFLTGNAGVSFHKKTFHAGVVLPNLFQPIYLSDQSFNVTAIKPFQSVMLHASNRFYFNNDKNVFEPYLIYRLNSNLPSQFEAAAVVHLEHLVWVGGSYKQNFGISALAGLKLQNLFAVGFSYSVKNTGVNQLASPSFEIQLALLTGQKKKEVSAYSFVDTHKEKVRKKSQAELAAERKKNEAALAAKAAETKKLKDAQLAKEQAAKDKAAADKAAADKLAAATALTVVAKKDTVRGGPRKKVEDDPLAQKQLSAEEQAKLDKIVAQSSNPNAVNTDTASQARVDRHEFVKQGANADELAVGSYVVVGVFSSKTNAGNFVKGLSRMGYDAQFGYLTEKEFWYVYLFRSDDINVVRSARDKSRKLKVFKDAWLLTVHP